MKSTLRPGLEHEATFEITPDMTAPHLPRAVLATPTMISLIEHVCMLATRDHVDDGETTVGTHVCVSHDGPAAPGERITIHGRLDKIEKRRLTFSVEVRSPHTTISQGTHQRAVVDLNRYKKS